MKHPSISCVCLTYGRPRILEEAIHSFLTQDYAGLKELIVLNDFSGQRLEFYHPDVKIINVPVRFNTLGEKRNAAVSLCSHDLVFPWDDDDIHLPHRISFSVEQFNRKNGFFKMPGSFVWNGQAITNLMKGGFHGTCCFSREIFAAVRGYPHINSGEDQQFEHQLNEYRPNATVTAQVIPKQVYYIYRWSDPNSYNISTFNGTDNARMEAYQNVATLVEDKYATRQQVNIRLSPQWRFDYVQLTKDYLQANW